MEVKGKGFFGRIRETVDYWLSEKGAPEYIIISIVSFIFFAISTATHELLHVVTARFLGCQSVLKSLDFITGMTGIADGCPEPSLQIIALSAPVGVFLLAIVIWFWEPDSENRILALIMFFLSSILQLWPGYEHLDAGRAVSWGLSPVVAGIIFIVVFSIFANLLWLEIADKRPERFR